MEGECHRQLEMTPMVEGDFAVHLSLNIDWWPVPLTPPLDPLAQSVGVPFAHIHLQSIIIHHST